MARDIFWRQGPAIDRVMKLVGYAERIETSRNGGTPGLIALKVDDQDRYHKLNLLNALIRTSGIQPTLTWSSGAPIFAHDRASSFRDIGREHCIELGQVPVSRGLGELSMQ